MAVLRTDIERALDELASQEEGMRFQGLAMVLGKMRWPELIARQRKKDMGLDAYATASLTKEKIGKGLAASITPTLKKIAGDAQTAKENFPDLKALLFVTSAKVGNADRERWQEEIQNTHGIELHIIEREEIITQMMMPENASLCATCLNIRIDAEPVVAEIIDKTRRASATVTRAWASKVKGLPLMELAGMRIKQDGEETDNELTLEQIDQALSLSGRIVLEGHAGYGKTTTLIQLAQRARTVGTPIIVELPAWISSRKGILEFIAGMPAFQAEGLTPADLARMQQTEPLLFLLNGWNEIAESNSSQANDALREVERDFPSAGIIVATRTHHLKPPLPGAMRLRLLRLRRFQRATYLTTRLGAEAAELIARINADPSLDELTRTPFILSEVASLFEAGSEIPSTKIDILAQVIHLQEQRDEHRNALQITPIFGEQTEYLKTLATEMSRQGAVAMTDADARSVVAAVTRRLADRGIQPVDAPKVLAALTAHDVLERVDYPQTAFRFEHQQLQEYYAALDVRTQLINLPGDDLNAIDRFTAEYVNDLAWAEPLRMIAETFANRTSDGEVDRKNIQAGKRLVEITLTVDIVFAAELAHLCGPAVWNEVSATVGDCIRNVYLTHNGYLRQYAIAAMLATRADDFSDIIVPLLSGHDQQTRLHTYRLWPDTHPLSIGPDWREQVRGWTEPARTDFVSELLHHRDDGDIATFAAEDQSIAVKEAAVSGLMWKGSDGALARVLDSMDAGTFQKVACQNADIMPAAFRPRTIAAMRDFIKNPTEPATCLRTALHLLDLGETDLEGVIKDSLTALTEDEIRNLGSHYIGPALKYLRLNDPGWTSDWVATQFAEGVLYDREYWLPLATAISGDLVEKYLQRIESKNLNNLNFKGMISIIAARADANLAARVFTKLRDLRREMDAEEGKPHELKWQVMHKLQAVFAELPGEIAAAGILSSVKVGDPLDFKVAVGLFSSVARSEVEPLRITNEDLKAHLRTYLKDSVDVVLRQDDYTGEQKANLASSIAQVGKPEDMTDLVTLIHADIDRMRRGRAARATGDKSSLSDGAIMNYSGWNIAAVMQLDPTGAEQVLIDLLAEPEYLSEVAATMVREFLPKPSGPFDRKFRYDLMWASREGRVPTSANEHRRTRFAIALNDVIKRLQEQNQGEKPAAGLKDLARALAAIDGRNSAAAVLAVIAIPGQWDQYICLDAAERLLMAGIILPTATAFALVDSMLERTEKWMQDSDRHLLSRILALCPFVDNPAKGIAKIANVLGKRRLQGHELRELVTALGESRSIAAVDFLYELALDAQTFNDCEDNFINSFAALDTPRAQELLLGFVDPDIRGIVLTRRLQREDVLIARLTELAQHRPGMSKQLRVLCQRDLPEPIRQILSKVMGGLGTPEDLAANLNLIDDAKPKPIPDGAWDQLENSFIERRPYEQNANIFTQRARASNEIRAQLFRMTIIDEKRRKSALMLLGQIEEWRLDYGRPMGEPRHPDLASGKSWPPKQSQ